MGYFNSQNKYLAGLVTVLPVVRLRNQNPEDEASFNQSSYCYRVWANLDGSLKDVCYKAFESLHTITNRHVQTIKKKLVELGDAKPDKQALTQTDVISCSMKQEHE